MYIYIYIYIYACVDIEKKIDPFESRRVEGVEVRRGETNLIVRHQVKI